MEEAKPTPRRRKAAPAVATDEAAPKPARRTRKKVAEEAPSPPVAETEAPKPRRTARPRKVEVPADPPPPPPPAIEIKPVAADSQVESGEGAERGPGGWRRRGGRRRGRGRPGEGVLRVVETEAPDHPREGAEGERSEGAEGASFERRRGRHRRRGRGRRPERVPLTPEEQAALDAKRAAEAAAKEERRRIAEQQRAEAQRRKAEREAARRAQQEAQKSKRMRRRPPSFGETWWSARWTAVLETFGWAARVSRGAEYARAGAVTDIAMDEMGVVLAAVQGSRPEPYAVELSLAHLPDDVWEAVLDEMSSNALLAAQLLAGDMPQDIEDAFFNVGVTLFPYDGQEIYADCDCPDEVNPCKHIAAVFYTLAQEFDRDPFLIFRFRGKSSEQVAAYLRAKRAEAETVEEEEVAPPEPEDKPLSECLDQFWRAGDGLEGLRLQIAPPVTPGAVLMRLGQPNGWDGARGFIFTMAPFYQAFSERALAAAYAESPEQPKVAPETEEPAAEDREPVKSDAPGA